MTMMALADLFESDPESAVAWDRDLPHIAVPEGAEVRVCGPHHGRPDLWQVSWGDRPADSARTMALIRDPVPHWMSWTEHVAELNERVSAFAARR